MRNTGSGNQSRFRHSPQGKDSPVLRYGLGNRKVSFKNPMHDPARRDFTVASARASKGGLCAACHSEAANVRFTVAGVRQVVIDAFCVLAT